MHLYARTRFIPLQYQRVPLGVEFFSHAFGSGFVFFVLATQDFDHSSAM